MTVEPTIALRNASVGLRGRIHALAVEGTDIELPHEGLFGRDPIAPRGAHATIALRRREAVPIGSVIQPVTGPLA